MQISGSSWTNQLNKLTAVATDAGYTDVVDRVIEPVRQMMESVVQLRVPLKVDAKMGKNWRDVLVS